jgi:hypothetical protein
MAIQRHSEYEPNYLLRRQSAPSDGRRSGRRQRSFNPFRIQLRANSLKRAFICGG